VSAKLALSVNGRDHQQEGEDARSSTLCCVRVWMLTLLECLLGGVLGSIYVGSRAYNVFHLHLV